MVQATSQQEFSDADWRAVATADQSKKLKLLLSGLTTGTTRVLTIPDADGTIMLTSAIGTTVQGYDALLAAIAALTTAAGGFIRTTGVDTVAAQAIVGTVSQSGGVPTGAIIEKGSNSNGIYTRWADGTQICGISEEVTNQAISTAYGTLFQGTRSWTFPAAFSAVPTLGAPFAHWGTGRAWGSMVALPTTTTAFLTFFDIASRATGTAFQYGAIAFGRWFN